MILDGHSFFCRLIENQLIVHTEENFSCNSSLVSKIEFHEKPFPFLNILSSEINSRLILEKKKKFRKRKFIRRVLLYFSLVEVRVVETINFWNIFI